MNRLNTSLLITERARSRFHASNRPDFLLIFQLIATEAKTTSTTFCFPPLLGLTAQSERNTLEVLLHAPLRARRESASGARAGHVLVEDLGVFVDDVEQSEESCFGGKLDGDDHVAHRGENGRDDGGEVRAHDVVVLAGDGAEDDECEATCVN